METVMIFMKGSIDYFMLTHFQEMGYKDISLMSSRVTSRLSFCQELSNCDQRIEASLPLFQTPRNEGRKIRIGSKPN
jgi:hypothetical protein